MIDGLRLELKDIEPIVSADLDINKINVVGGKNATGKSTASKLLYCFLKINSSDREKLVASTMTKSLVELYRHFRVLDRRSDRSLSHIPQTLRKITMMLNRQTYVDFEEVIELFDEIEPDIDEYLEETRFLYEFNPKDSGLYTKNSVVIDYLQS